MRRLCALVTSCCLAEYVAFDTFKLLIIPCFIESQLRSRSLIRILGFNYELLYKFNRKYRAIELCELLCLVNW